MDPSALKELQASLPARYRDDPGSAVVTLVTLTECYRVVQQTPRSGPTISVEVGTRVEP